MLSRYPGSKPFTIEYQHLFFGRDKDIAELSKFINVQKITVLYGKSGLGKSSLLNAGVIPKLQRDKNYLPVFVRFGSYSEQSPTFPLETFHLKIAEQMQSPPTVLSSIDSESVSLWQTFKNYQLSHATSQTILLVFDQFEELFTYPTGVETFAQQFAELLNNKMPKAFAKNFYDRLEENPDSITEQEINMIEKDVNVKVVFSIRSDRMSFLNRLADFIPTILKNCYELKSLTSEQAITAIVKPANEPDANFISQPFSYESDAIEKIVSFLSKNGQHAIETFLLQLICQNIENTVIKNNLQIVSNNDIGDLHNISMNFYDNIISELPEKERNSVIILLEEGLIFEEEKRRLSLYEGIIYKKFDITKELLQKLINTHLLRCEPHHEGGFVYEVSHDALVAPILKAKRNRLHKKQRELADIERKLELEQIRQEQEEERLKRKVEKQRTNRIILTISIFLVLMIGVSIFAFVQMRIANYEKERALNLFKETNQQKRDEGKINTLLKQKKDLELKVRELDSLLNIKNKKR